MVAKLHKIAERSGGTRQKDKDALDLHRLLLSQGADLPGRFQALLQDEHAANSTQRALEHFQLHFGTPESTGCRMVAQALGELFDSEAEALACSLLAQELLDALAT